MADHRPRPRHRKLGGFSPIRSVLAGGISFCRRVLQELTNRAVLNGTLLEVAFLAGLAGVFLVNAVVAVVDPDGFLHLVAQSPAGPLLNTRAGQLIAPAIAVNDFLVGTAVLTILKLRKLRAPVLAWAGVWLMIVTLTKLFAID